MNYRKKLWQKRVGNLLVLLLLIAQSTPLWASMAPLVPVQPVMAKDCTQMMGQTKTVKHPTCQQNCCQQVKHCSTTCFMQCTFTALNVMPVSHTMINPRFYLTLVSQFQASAPVGRGLEVLERPPCEFT